MPSLPAQRLADGVDLVTVTNHRPHLANGAAEVISETVEHILGPQHEIDHSGRDCREGHPVIARRAWRLHQCQPSMLLDRAQAQCAVGPGSRQDHTSRQTARILGQRHEEVVNRSAQAARLVERFK